MTRFQDFAQRHQVGFTLFMFASVFLNLLFAVVNAISVYGVCK